MSSILEGALRFEFGDAWRVLKYDDHHVYRYGIERLKQKFACDAAIDRVHEVGTKAVDIVGVRNGNLYLIEVKDFRKHRIENKRRLQNGELAIEVALKVRDTIAGLLGAIHGSSATDWHPFIQALVAYKTRVLLWVEEDFAVERFRSHGHPTLMTLADAISQRLRWLNPHVEVINQHSRLECLQLSVANLADGIVRLRDQMRHNKIISREDYCAAWNCTAQTAGQQLEDLCRRGVLVLVKKEGSYIYQMGKLWAEWYGA